MNKLLNVYKPIGMTPYQLIQKVKQHFPEYKDEPIGFAGRLDPLAHGVQLLMIGEATKDRDTYLNLPKTYEFEAFFGLATDTYDVLGILANDTNQPPPKNIQTEIECFIKSKLGKQTQQYPPYSSKTVQGKPLFLWAKENRLSEITIPEREIEIYDFKLLKQGEITMHQLQKQITENIAIVQGDFRQKEILERWHDFFSKTKRQTFPTARFMVNCSSGTYVRGLVHSLGEQLKTGAVTLEIVRTKVGKYRLADAIRV